MGARGLKLLGDYEDTGKALSRVLQWARVD